MAFDALDHAYNIGYVVCAAAALLSFALAVGFLRTRTSELTVPHEALDAGVAEPAVL